MTLDAAPVHLSAGDCRLADLIDLVNQKTDLADYPYAHAAEQNVLIYDGARLRKELSRPVSRPRVEAELARALLDGPGIVVLAGAFDDPWVIDRATWQFEAMIAAQRAAGGAAGDHFAAAGQNDRIWNALEKLAPRAGGVRGLLRQRPDRDRVPGLARTGLPGHFASQRGQPGRRRAGGAPGLPSGVRLRHPGRAVPGARPPAHPGADLAGAVAHKDMPAETGPTMYLPHSDKYLPGYLAWRQAEFREYFEYCHVQLPLRKGDAVFFNPALFHAAGANRTGHVRRMANLLQVSSAFGRSMEAVDRSAMSAAVSPALQAMADDGASPAMIANVIAACAEGYPFPANLDLDQPAGGLAPAIQADILARAVAEGGSRQQLETELGAWSDRRQTRRPS